MNEAMKSNQAQTCLQCGSHCPVDAFQCGRGRQYFGVTEGGYERGRKDGQRHRHEGHSK